MDKLYEELFRAMNQFRKLKFAVSDDQQDRFFRNVYDYG